MVNLFTTEKQLPVRRDPLRQNRRNNPPPLFSFSTIVVPIGHRKGILIRQCLEDNDPNTRTSRTSSINRCSNRLGYSVTYVMSRRRERLGWTNHEWSDHLHWGSDKKKTSVLPEFWRLHPLHACHPRSLWKETKLILHCLVTWKFRTCGVSTLVTLVLLSVCILLSIQIAGGKDRKDGRQTVFFTAFNPMTDFQEEEYHDVTKPRKVQCKTKWKVFQDAEKWISLRNAQDQGLAFWQTRSNAIVLHDSIPADCVERVVNTKTEETLYQKVSLFPRTSTT